jgi:hypothetical protein
MGTPNSTFSITPQPQKTLGGLLSPLSNMNQQIKNSPVLNPTGQSSAPIPVPASASQPMNPATSSVVPGLLNPHPTAPTTNPVKSHTTTTNPDGTTTTKQTYDTTTGFLTPEGIAEGKPAVQPGDPNAPQAPVSKTAPGTNANNGTNFQQNLSNVQNTGNQTSNENTTLTGLIGQSQQPSQAYTQGMANYDTANQKLADFNSQLAQTDKNISAQGISLDSARGQMANVGQAATAEEAALQGGVTNASNILGAANTQQGLEVQAGTAANTAAQTTAQRNLAAQEGVAGLTQPQQVSPGNTLVSPATGQAQYGLGTGAGGNGADAYQNFSNLKFNTEAGQNFSQQANSLQTAANQTDQNFATLQQAAAGINLSSFPSINAASQFLQTQAGGAGKVSALNEAYNALQTSMASIINSGGSGLTPTQITSLTNGQNISSLSPAQLMTLYNTVQQTMKTKISTTQQQAIKAEQAGTGFNNGSSTNNSSSGLYNF